MTLENAHILDRILDVSNTIDSFDLLDGIDYHLTEELHLIANDLTAHTSSSTILQSICFQFIHSDHQIVFNVLDTLSGCHFEPTDNTSGVDFVFDQFIGLLQ